MRIALMVITDGRAWCLKRTLASFDNMVDGPVVDRLIVDDSLDPAYAAWLDETYPAYRRMHHAGRRRGFCGAIQSGWSAIPSEVDFLVHLEDDFVFECPVDLSAMAHVLATHPELVQLVLKRQAWNDQEKAAGGIVEQWPDEYVDRRDAGPHDVPLHWLEHRLFFSTNPTIYRRSLLDLGWPGPPACEGEFTRRVLEDPAARFAFWGKRDDPPWVTHIGLERAGSGY